MNKLFTKIAGIALGLTMAIGVGVAVGSEKTAKEVNAASATYSMTPNNDTSGSTSGSYVTTDTAFTHEGVSWKLRQWNPTSLQVKTNQSSAGGQFCFYTSTFDGNITQVVISFRSTGAMSDATKMMMKGSASAFSAQQSSGGSSMTWNATDKTLTWTANASDGYKAIAFYQNGKAMSGSNYLAESNAIVVTYEAEDAKTLTSITLGGDYQTNFGVGDTFNHNGMTVTANYEGGSTKDVTSSASWSSPDMSTAGEKTVTVSYSENNVEKTANYTINVKGVDHITISGQTTSFDQGDVFVFGGIVTAYYTDNTDADVTSEATFTGYDMSSTGEQTVTVSYGGQSTTYEITVNAASVFTFVAGTDTGSSSASGSEDTVSKGPITIHGDDAAFATAQYRFYKGSTTTISTSSGSIAKIEFTGVSGNPISNFTAQEGWATSENDGTWTGNAVSVSFVASAAQARATQVKVTLASSEPSVELAPGSATSVAMLKGDSDTSIKVLVSNIEYPEWAFTFDEGEETGLATSAYVNVEASELDSNNIATLTVTTKANGSTKLHIAASEVACASTVDITVSPKPQAGTMVAKLGGEVVTGAVECKTGEHVQFTFAAEDTDGGAYTVTAAALTATIVSGDAYGSLYGTTGVNGTVEGTVVARYALSVLESVYVDVIVNVLDDYLESVILETFAFNTGLTATQGESPTDAVFAVRNGLTHFGETQVIPFEDFRFSYIDEMGVIGTQFTYDFSHGTAVDDTHKNQTIYVYCTLGNVKVGEYNVLVEQFNAPLTAITLTNVAEHAKSIDLGGSFQLEWSYTPTNPTDGKEVVFRLENETDGSEISVNETGLISAGKVAGAKAKVIIESGHNDKIFDYVNVTVAMAEMTYKVGSADAGWVLVEDISTLSAGDQVILTGVKDEVTYAAGVYTSGNNVKADTAHPLTVSDNKVTGVEDSMVYTLETGSVAGSLAFKDSTGKYLYAAGGNGEGGADVKNYLKAQSNIDGNASFLLNADGTVVAQGDCPNGYMRYNNSDSGQIHNNLFNCYKSTSTIGTLVTFYKLNANVTLTVDEDLYNAIYMNFGTGKTFTCDGDGKSFNATKWANAGEAITGLADFEDYMLNKAVADENGNMVENFLAMYDYVIAKKEAGNKIYAGATDFLGRFEANGINHQVALTLRAESAAASDNTIKIIVVISLISLSATLGCVLIRKRRTDR